MHDFKSYTTGDESSDAAPSGAQRYVCPRDSCSRMDFDSRDAVVGRADPGRHDFLTRGQAPGRLKAIELTLRGKWRRGKGRLAGFLLEGESRYRDGWDGES